MMWLALLIFGNIIFAALVVRYAGTRKVVLGTGTPYTVRQMLFLLDRLTVADDKTVWGDCKFYVDIGPRKVPITGMFIALLEGEKSLILETDPQEEEIGY